MRLSLETNAVKTRVCYTLHLIGTVCHIMYCSFIHQCSTHLSIRHYLAIASWLAIFIPISLTLTIVVNGWSHSDLKWPDLQHQIGTIWQYCLFTVLHLLCIYQHFLWLLMFVTFWFWYIVGIYLLTVQTHKNSSSQIPNEAQTFLVLQTRYITLKPGFVHYVLVWNLGIISARYRHVWRHHQDSCSFPEAQRHCSEWCFLLGGEHSWSWMKACFDRWQACHTCLCSKQATYVWCQVSRTSLQVGRSHQWFGWNSRHNRGSSMIMNEEW